MGTTETRTEDERNIKGSEKGNTKLGTSKKMKM
jgi:hypothetical protein